MKSKYEECMGPKWIFIACKLSTHLNPMSWWLPSSAFQSQLGGVKESAFIFIKLARSNNTISEIS
jgi:hypothetical protein